MPSSPHLIIRSSWQTVNIGDIAHTPGLLQLLEGEFPDYQLTLWANPLDFGVRPLLEKLFPRVTIIEEGGSQSGMPQSRELQELWDRADFFLHGSAPYVVAEQGLHAWRKSGRPFGLMGVTIETPSPQLIEMLEDASFVFTRETASIARLRDAGLINPEVAFAPDATFQCHVADPLKGLALMKRFGLEPGKFLCVIPRLRFTPYYKIHHRPPTALELERNVINEHWMEIELSKVRSVVTAWVRETGLPVLICPEMTYEVEVGLHEIRNKLPDDVRAHVHALDYYWLTDEASAVYAESTGLLSMECHSPILAIEQGIPALYLRQPTDTIKGQMYRDLGLDEWILEIETASEAEITETVLRFAGEPEMQRQRARDAADRARGHLSLAASKIREALTHLRPRQ
jgi:hypothetical protein